MLDEIRGRRATRDVSRRSSEVGMKTHGEIEAAICEGISRFEQEYEQSLHLSMPEVNNGNTCGGRLGPSKPRVREVIREPSLSSEV